MKTHNLNYEEALYLANLFEQFNELITFDLFLENYLESLEQEEKYEECTFLKNILNKINEDDRK